jgi:hypothetical protein
MIAFLATPADAALLARMFAWRLCLPVLKYAMPLPRLVRLMSTRARRGDSGAGRERRIVAMTTWLYRPAGSLATDDDCLERSLLSYRYLSREGAEPRLVVGMRRGSDQARRGSDPSPRGHVWVTIRGRSPNDTEAFLERFAPVVTFGPGGVQLTGDDL